MQEFDYELELSRHLSPATTIDDSPAEWHQEYDKENIRYGQVFARVYQSGYDMLRTADHMIFRNGIVYPVKGDWTFFYGDMGMICVSICEQEVARQMTLGMFYPNTHSRTIFYLPEVLTFFNRKNKPEEFETEQFLKVRDCVETISDDLDIDSIPDHLNAYVEYLHLHNRIKTGNIDVFVQDGLFPLHGKLNHISWIDDTFTVKVVYKKDQRERTLKILITDRESLANKGIYFAKDCQRWSSYGVHIPNEVKLEGWHHIR